MTSANTFWDMLVIKLMSVGFVVICMVGFAGCKDKSAAISLQKAASHIVANGAPTTEPAVYDVGVISKDVVYDCVIGGSESRIVDSVTKSCGCATVGLNKGDVLDFSKPFKVSVSMRGKRPGKGSNDILLVFKNGTLFRAKLKYDYRPPPTASPEYLIFKASENKKSIAIAFPGESDVKVEKVVLPANIVCSALSHRDGRSSEAVLEFKVNRVLVSESKDGVIDVSTSSDRQAKFRIPYLILEN